MIKICSHRRSGTHLLMETLNQNFEVKLTEGVSKTHRPYHQIKDKFEKMTRWYMFIEMLEMFL